MRRNKQHFRQLLLITVSVILFFSSFLLAEEETKKFNSPVDPQLYLMRPGDNLVVTFINSKISAITLEIGPEGKIVDETIGLIDLQNKTLAYAKNILSEKLQILYNVKDIQISVTNPREVSIAIYGAIRRPGIYSGYTSDRVSQIIEKAGGILENGSSRNILFKSKNTEVGVDLDRAIYLGDLQSNPPLYAGTSIEVPGKQSQTVHVTGDVNFPREIELKENDNIESLILLAGNFKNTATLKDVQIIRGNKIVEKALIQKDDIINVKSNYQSEKTSIKIFGAITNPGVYQLSDNQTLSQLIVNAGGYDKTANQKMTTIFRQPLVDSHGQRSIIRYPISIPLQQSTPTPMALEINDSIFVPWKVGFVKIGGAVLNPGYFPYSPDKDISFYVNSAGGFLPTANKEEIKIYNPISQNTELVSSGTLVPDGAEIVVQVKEELK